MIVNPAYKQQNYDPFDTATEEDMEPTVMEAPQNNTVPRRVTKRENINLVRQTEWDVKGTKRDNIGQRSALSKPVSVLLGLVCFTSCVSLVFTLLILSGSVETGRCSCGDTKGIGSNSAMEADDEPIKEFSGNISSLDEQMEKMNDKNSDQEDQLLKEGKKLC